MNQILFAMFPVVLSFTTKVNSTSKLNANQGKNRYISTSNRVTENDETGKGPVTSILGVKSKPADSSFTDLGITKEWVATRNFGDVLIPDNYDLERLFESRVLKPSEEDKVRPFTLQFGLDTKVDYLHSRFKSEHPDLAHLDFKVVQSLASTNLTLNKKWVEWELDWIAANETPDFIAAQLSRAENEDLMRSRRQLSGANKKESEEKQKLSEAYAKEIRRVEMEKLKEIANLFDNANLFVSEYPIGALPMEESLGIVLNNTEILRKTEEAFRNGETYVPTEAERTYSSETLYNFKKALFNIKQRGGSIMAYLQYRKVDMTVFPLSGKVTF